jgi:hypothetical protein
MIVVMIVMLMMIVAVAVILCAIVDNDMELHGTDVRPNDTR